MKKRTAFALALILTLTLCACGGGSSGTNQTPNGALTPSAPASSEKPVNLSPAPESTASAAPAGPGVQELWNGWYFGCVDLSGCTGQWADRNGETYDAVMYVELGGDGKGRLAIWDPFGKLVSNEHSNKYVDAACHGDAQYLYADSGQAFDCEIDPSDWVFVHNLSIPEKLNVGSASTNDAGETVGYDFQFKPWGDRWEGDDYTQFIPYFSAYLDGLDAGLTSPFGDTFSGFGIAQPASGGESAPPVSGSASSGSAPSGGRSDLLGANPAKLDVNDRGIVNLYYPGDQFVYDDLYGKLKNESTGVGILLDPMLGATNLEELRQSYQENNSDEDDYSLTEITVNGYKALLLKYSDFLGSTMRVDVDFGGNHDGWYGLSFAVSGDSLADCDADLVWAVIESMEVVK